MNEFHEINILTSRGDINGSLSLISQWSESIARKIMKKAGYSVTPHAGRAFWAWVQATLTDSARQRRCGYRVRAERRAPVRYNRQQALENYDAYAQMMASDVAAQAEAAPEGNIAPVDTGPEKSITVSGCAEGLVDLRRHGQPAPARPVSVLQLQHPAGRIVARAAKKRGLHCMPVHSVLPLRSARHIASAPQSGMTADGAIPVMTVGDALRGLPRRYPQRAAQSDPLRVFTAACNTGYQRRHGFTLH